MAKRAIVIRGVYIRGTPYAEGKTGSVGTEKQPGDDFVVSPQEYAELKNSNYLAAAPEVKVEPPKPEVKAEKAK